MAECYLLAIARGGSLDRDTNNWTLFALTEQILLTPGAPPAGEVGVGLPLEVHVYWQFDVTELGRTLEFRLIFSNGEDEKRTQAFEVVSTNPRHRTRIAGAPLLLEGDTRMKVEWRLDQSGDWTKSPAFWPFVVQRQPA